MSIYDLPDDHPVWRAIRAVIYIVVPAVFWGLVLWAVSE